MSCPNSPNHEHQWQFLRELLTIWKHKIKREYGCMWCKAKDIRLESRNAE